MTQNSRKILVGDGIRILSFFVFVAIVLTFAAFLPFSESIKIWLRPLLVLGASWFCIRAENETLSSIGLRINAKFFRELLLGAMLGMAIIFASAFAIMLLGGFTFQRAAGVDLGTLFFSLVPFLALGIFEELMFRGYAFQCAIRRLGGALALLLFALLFIAAHLGNPGMEGGTKAWASLNIGIASVLLGLAWMRTKSLALPIGIHVGWNWAQGGFLGFGVSGTKTAGYLEPIYLEAPKWVTGGNFGLEASLPTAVAALAVCVIMAFWVAGNKKNGAC
jgi:membrane protease YdiL (CAAX protease family)